VKVLSVVGNRPQFIKSAPLGLALREAAIDEVVLHTGQHYDPELSQVFFDELGLPEPRYRLEARTSDPAAMRPGIGEAIRRERPDWVLVYGDTNSTLAGAEAAAAAGVPVAHVEAGLRSGDLAMPEERNRIEVDGLATLLLAPDERSRETLEAERVAGRIEVVGDVMYDATLRFAPIARARWAVPHDVFALVTVHREANVREHRLRRIVDGLNRLDLDVVFPAHPRTRAAIEGAGLTVEPHVELVEPVGYLELAALASGAHLIVTDSGGLQKEAYWHGVRCVTLRPSTEWADTVEVGANELVDDDPQALARAARRALDHGFPENAPRLYGDGNASRRVAAALIGSLTAA
jgi:UDP-N-acetylglucosamine 2-epimerase